MSLAIKQEAVATIAPGAAGKTIVVTQEDIVSGDGEELAATSEELTEFEGTTLSIKDEPVVKQEVTDELPKSIVLREVNGHLVQEVDITSDQLSDNAEQRYELVQLAAQDGGSDGEPQYIVVPESSQLQFDDSGAVLVYKDEPDASWRYDGDGETGSSGNSMNIIVGPDDITSVSNVDALYAIQSLMPNTRVIAPRGRPASAHTEMERVVNRREKDRVRKQVLRMNSDYRDKEKEQSRLRMRKLRRDPVYRQRERDRDCLRRRLSRRYNSEMRNKEKEREKLHKRLVKTLSDLYMTNHGTGQPDERHETELAAEAVDGAYGLTDTNSHVTPLSEEQAYARRPKASPRADRVWPHELTESAIATNHMGNETEQTIEVEDTKQFIPSESVIEIDEQGQVVSMSDGQLVAQMVSIDGSEAQMLVDENGQQIQVITVQPDEDASEVVTSEVVTEETVLETVVPFQ